VVFICFSFFNVAMMPALLFTLRNGATRIEFLALVMSFKRLTTDYGLIVYNWRGMLTYIRRRRCRQGRESTTSKDAVY